MGVVFRNPDRPPLLPEKSPFTNLQEHAGLNLSIGKVLRIAAAVVISVYAPGILTPVMGKAAAVTVAGGLAGYVATGTIQGALMGAFSAQIFSGIGEHFDGLTDARGGVMNSGLSPTEFAMQAVSHGIAGGTINFMQGGKFGHGFASAGLTKVASPAISQSFDGNRFGQGILAAAVGGTISSATGGKFANGAVTAAMAYAFNQVAPNSRNSRLEKAAKGANLATGTVVKLTRVGEATSIVDAFNDAIDSIRSMDEAQLAEFDPASGAIAKRNLGAGRELAETAFRRVFQPRLQQLVILNGIELGQEFYFDIATANVRPSLVLLFNAANFSVEFVNPPPDHSGQLIKDMQRATNNGDN